MTTLLLSDVHLDAGPRGAARTAAFAEFLRAIKTPPVERVIVLGDLFDFWFEYRHVIFSAYFEVLRAFAELRDRGVACHLVCGNHDFWAGRFLRDELGMQVQREPVTLDFGGRRVLLLHGDGLNPRDWPYRVFKRLARSGCVIRLFRALHPDWAMALAQCVSHGSRELTRMDDLAQGSEARALRAFAQGVLAEGKADVVICGHSHYPVAEEHPTPDGTGLYLNTGDFVNQRSWVEWDGAEFRLRRSEDG